MKKKALRKKRILSKYDGKKHGWLHLGAVIIIAVIVALLAMYTVMGFSRVEGKSMEPTLYNNQVIAFFRLTGDLDNGDIVALKMPSGEKYVKRVIGTEGDVIDIKDGKVYRNGVRLDEIYTKGKTEESGNKITYPYSVEEGKAFVMGDNRENSVDSRTFGPVVLEIIKGKVLFQ